MSLDEYRRKRDFTQTPEPSGSAAENSSTDLRFVVQKHAARRLHYDLRLELDGVLLSWAVPKGPSLNPQDKRLARRTEDHPLEYRNFEGNIPEGEYGAGSMIIWDEGVYQAVGTNGRDQSVEALRAMLAKGDFKLLLRGSKLRGEFHLFQMKGSRNADGGNWLLVKKDDEYASSADVLVEGESVRSGEKLEELSARRPVEGEDGRFRINASELDLGGAKRSAPPGFVEPMLASLVGEPFDSPEWLFELKWDGFRAFAETGPDAPRLYSRKQLDFREEFPPILSELRRIAFHAVFDGEIVVIDEAGKSSFKLLQQYRRTGKGTLLYYIFDLLHLEGVDLRKLPLERRKQLLRQVLPPTLTRLRFSDHITDNGVDFFKLAVQNGLEGVIAKLRESQYRPGVRSTEWLKVKVHRRQEVVIGGYTQPRGGRKRMGALLLGMYEGRDLVFVGHTGGGFTDEELDEVHARLQKLERSTAPFRTPPRTNMPATWTEPELVCEVQFAEWTADNQMRMPIFMGLRPDCDPRDVRREQPVATPTSPAARRYAAPQSKETLVYIGNIELSLTNLNKLYYPEDGITKGDVIEYYRSMSTYILPYLAGRAANLNRFPNGIHGKNFYQKDMDSAPGWAHTHPIPSDASTDPVDYLVVENEASLVYAANLGAIELHPWNSRIDRLDRPDYLVFDLDPADQTFDDVITVALKFHELLDAIGAVHLPRTSGKDGVHIFVPLGGQYTYEQTRQFGQIINEWVRARLPELTTSERSIKKRGGRMYLDILQNRPGQTLVAPYGLRPVRGAPVSTPLRWDEVRPGLRPADFHMRNILERVQHIGDLWRDVLGPGIDLAHCLQRLKAQF